MNDGRNMRRKNTLAGLYLLILGISAFSPVLKAAAPEMILVRGGSFLMGSPAGGKADTAPVHTVTLDPFFIGRYEVTQAEWQAVMGHNPSLFKGDDRPVEQVSWADAVTYCNKRSEKEGLTPCYRGSGAEIECDLSADGFRLPSEAEWEYAARGGAKSRDYRYSGGYQAGDVAWYEANSRYVSQAVGKMTANELGIHDMSGNVWEWCWDWYSPTYYRDSPAKNPAGPLAAPGQTERTYRGGGFGGTEEWLRPSNRYHLPPAYSRFDMGLRVVRKGSGPLPAGMIRVDGGTFSMGSPRSNNGESPQRRVSLDSFYIGRTEVTQAEWISVMGYNPSFFPGGRSPVECVGWTEAVEYCNRLSQQEGLTPCYRINGNKITRDMSANGFRLPSEAEWEYAARGGEAHEDLEYSGSSQVDEVGWYYLNAGFQVQAVGQKKPNALGIYDMSGNVQEWCWDEFDFDAYLDVPVKTPAGENAGIRRVARGGSAFSNLEDLRTVAREWALPCHRFHYFGFRLARNAPGKNIKK